MVAFYVFCLFLCLGGCEEKRQTELSYKEVETEVFLLDDEERKSVLASDVAASLDTIDWSFRDKHGYLQPSVFFHVHNRTCETLSVYMQELYRKDHETWTLLPCSVSQVSFGNVISPPGMVWSNSVIRFCLNGYDLKPGLYMLQSRMSLCDSLNSRKYGLEAVFLLY